MSTSTQRQSAATADTGSDPEFNDMQALVRFGHGRLRESCFMLLTVRDRVQAGHWLQNAPFDSAAAQQTLPDTAMQIAFTPAGLQELGLSPEIVDGFSDEFIAGMTSDEGRSRRLGDVDDNAPQHWQWGFHNIHKLHVLLLLYALPQKLEILLDATRSEQFTSAFDVLHVLPTDTLGPREPFGFIDGISQPSIDWNQTQRTDVHARDSYSNLLAPGEIVLGYPNEYGQLTRSPLVKASTDPLSNDLPPASDQPEQRDFGRNGSYLVVRQLEQDVDGFWNFFRQHNDEETAKRLAALIVGRQADGEPLVADSVNPIPGIARGNRQNHFNYDADPQGLQCPVSSHVRRSNPRTGDFPPGVSGFLNRLLRALGFKRRSEYEDLIASTRFHRILRRGRTYGSAPDQTERGLQFMCLAGNILRQFEFVQSAWSTSSAFAGLHAQRDPITAHRQDRSNGAATDSFTYASAEGPQHKVVDLPQFVTVRGGAYFFLPGLKAVRYLGKQACITPDVESTQAESVS